MAQSASMNAYQRSSAEIWMQLQQEFAGIFVQRLGRRQLQHRTPVATTPVARFTSLGEAETSTGRAPSQIHDGANWKKSQEHRLSQGTRVVISRCNSHSRVISQHQNADRWWTTGHQRKGYQTLALEVSNGRVVLLLEE